MAAEPRGRTAPSPPPPFSKHIDDTFGGAYPWNAPRSAIGRDRPLTRGEFRQVQGVLGKVNRLPYVLKKLFNSRYDFIRRNKSPLHGFYFLKNTVEKRVQPYSVLKRSTSIKVAQPVTSQNTLRKISTVMHLMGKSITIPVNLSLILQQQ